MNKSTFWKIMNFEKINLYSNTIISWPLDEDLRWFFLFWLCSFLMLLLLNAMIWWWFWKKLMFFYPISWNFKIWSIEHEGIYEFLVTKLTQRENSVYYFLFLLENIPQIKHFLSQNWCGNWMNLKFCEKSDSKPLPRLIYPLWV